MRRLFPLAAVLFLPFTGFSGRATAQVVITSLPTGMLQPPGVASATDRFAVTNIGTTTAAVTLTQSENFFTVRPQTFTLDPGLTEAVTIAAAAQPSGTYRGFVAVTSSIGPARTVPVLLLVSDPPPVAVSAATSVQRLEHRPGPIVISPGLPELLSIPFTNRGTAPLTGVVGSDVPWITPSVDSVTIAPGATTNISVLVDPAKRPDGGILGSATGKVSLTYFSGASGTATASTVPPVAVSAVVVVDPNRLPVTAGTAPPLLPGEIAFFVAGSRGSSAVDLFLSHRSSNTAVTDLRVFYTAVSTGMPASVSTLSAVPQNFGVHLAGAMTESQSVQIRSAYLPSFAIAAFRFFTSDAGAFATSLPILRSDRGAAPGEKIVLAGLSSEVSTRTDLILQEVSGNDALLQINFRSRNGVVIATRNEALSKFAMRELVDAVPPNAFSVEIVNTSSGAARVAAFALVNDTTSRDAWTVTDPGAGFPSPPSEFLVPFFFVPANAQMQIHVVNRSGGPADVSFEVMRPKSRRRATARPLGATAHAHPVEPSAVTTIRLDAGQGETATVANAGTGGYIRITTAGGVFSGSARVVQRPSPIGHGASLPIIPATAALAVGQTKRFPGVDDAATTTIAARTPLTYRSDLMIGETGAGDALVRLSLHFLVATSSTSAPATATRTVSIEKGQFLFLPAVARQLIGSVRDALGDLRNMQLDIEVAGGAGRIITLLQSTENATGDLVVRAE